ncbi:MAG: extracellular solute-binding protein [Pirellulaceae bacterium]|nr:extracellular solute-binding protein [Pirellulaceae bacterium]
MLPRIFRARLAEVSLACAAGWCVALAFLAGCGPATSANKNANGKPRLIPQLTVLVVDDPALGENIQAEWRSRTEEEVTIRQISWKEAASAKRLPGDLIVYPSGQIGELAEAGLLAPISERTLENDAFALRDIYKQVRLHEMKWGDQVLALPLGSPQLMLVYRADIFAELKIKPPQTWAEYDALAVRLAKRQELGQLAPAADAPWRGGLEPLVPGYAGQVLLARSAAYAAHKEQISPLLELSTLKALIGQPPYVRALKEMAAGHNGKNEKLPRFTPAEVYQEIAGGRCAMAITWPTAASKKDKAAQDSPAPLGFAEVPGAGEVYDFGDKQWGVRGKGEDPHVPLLAVSGRMVSVTSTSGEPEAAENMATWLAGSEVAARISPASPDMGIFRISQEPDAGQWLGSGGDRAKSEYVAALRQTQERPRHSQGIRLPGRREYLSALDDAVTTALQGKKSPEDALAAAAAAWDKITARRGLDAQRAALERSLGLKNNQQ